MTARAVISARDLWQVKPRSECSRATSEPDPVELETAHYAHQHAQYVVELSHQYMPPEAPGEFSA